MTGERPTVLVIDDEEDVVAVYRLVLEDIYDVRTAHDGEGGLAALDDDVDVVLLDRRMPGMSGREVLEEIRSRDVDVRVAMVTAVDPDFDIVEMEFDGYLTKPVDDESLHEIVEELLTLSTYDDRTRERFAVAEKQAALEDEKTERELERNEEYATLQDRAAELDAEIDELADRMDETAFRRAISRLSDGSNGGADGLG